MTAFANGRWRIHDRATSPALLETPATVFRSIRPAVLLALVVAVACTDQPTEPTEAPEALQGVLAPPPAPPSVLSGDLAANEGGPSHVDLGDYESPVYSKVTVSGLLGYQGAGGYLPGTGQIDASGVVIQNQCDLIVVARAATGIIGGANTCPSQPRQIDSYVKYSIVNGHVDAYRTTGPPGSCWKYPAPCIHFTGSQSIKVEPQEGNIILTKSKDSVAAGGGIIITAKGVWAENNTTLVPMTVRQWTWEGSGKEVGGGHTKVCAAYSTNQCTVQVYQSGRVVLEALVNGKVKTASVEIAVIGGDTLPLPPPPDTMPHEPPDDSLPGGCGSGCCGGPMPTGVQLAGCQPPPDSLVIQVAISRPTAPPLLTRYYFDAIAQTHFSMGTGSRVDIDAPRPDVQTVTATAHWKHSGLPAAGVNLQISTEPIERSGGHIHTNGIARPVGSFFLPTENAQVRGGGLHRGHIDLTTDAEGQVTVTYRSSGIGGIEWVKASTQSDPAAVPRDSVGAVWRVPGLVELLPSPGDLYRFKPQFASNPTMRHGDNNRWLQSHFGDSLQFVFGEFFAEGGVIDDPESGGAFFITDIGLEFGGLNDVGANGEWQSPHMTHRTGLDIDIRSARDEDGSAVQVFSADDQSILHDVCYGTEELKWHPVIRCSFEPPPNGNPKHLHIEGWP